MWSNMPILYRQCEKWWSRGGMATSRQDKLVCSSRNHFSTVFFYEVSFPSSLVLKHIISLSHRLSFSPPQFDNLLLALRVLL